MSNVRFIGLDVHAETIAVAVAEPDGEVRSLGVIPNRPESIHKLVKKLGPTKHLRVCYEAGCTSTTWPRRPRCWTICTRWSTPRAGSHASRTQSTRRWRRLRRGCER